VSDERPDGSEVAALELEALTVEDA
jgi:hypothetical protein